MIEQLEAQIKVVVDARQKAAELKAFKNAAYAAWEDHHRETLNALTQAGAEVAEVEAKLRELTLQVYAQTGNKTPALGVGIWEVTKLEYDMEVAFLWAVEHRIALKLDTSAFEKIAKVSPPSFVTVFQEPQATIATQLAVEDD